MRLAVQTLLIVMAGVIGIGCGEPTAVDEPKKVEAAKPVAKVALKDAAPVAATKNTPKFKSITGIHFDSMEKITKAEIGQKKYKTSYKFTNTGKEAITIAKIKSSCVCTVADLQKRTYKPGEQGEIKAEIVFGQAKGKFAKHLYITVKSGDKVEMLTLSIGAIIPEFARITPRFLRWEHDEAPKPKRINVKIIHDEPIKVVKVTSSNPNWKTAFSEVKEGKEYSVEVTPSTTKKASRAAIMIEMDYPEKHPLVFKAVARVLQAESQGSTEEWMKDVAKQSQ